MNPLLAALLRRLMIPNFLLGVDAPAPAPAPAPADPPPAPPAPAPAPTPAPTSSPAPAPAPTAAPSPAPTPAPTSAPTPAPTAYSLKLAEGSPLDPSDVDKVAAYARERGLSNEQAQTILDQRHEAAAGLTQRQTETFEAAKAKWATDTRADPELGGVNFDATNANVKLVMDKFAPGADHPFRKELEATGYGNHPAFVRFVNAIGKAMGEDKPINGGAGATGQRSAADVLYGTS